MKHVGNEKNDKHTTVMQNFNTPHKYNRWSSQYIEGMWIHVIKPINKYIECYRGCPFSVPKQHFKNWFYMYHKKKNLKNKNCTCSILWSN